MASTEAITPEAIGQLAASLDLDVEKLKADMESTEVQAAIRRNRELAGALAVTSTPTFVVGSEVVAGAMDAAAFEALLNKARTHSGPKPQAAAHSTVQKGNARP